MKCGLTGLLAGAVFALLGCGNLSSLNFSEKEMGTIAALNNERELLLFFDTNKDEVLDLEFSYEITGTYKDYYFGKLKDIRLDSNKDGKFTLNERIPREKIKVLIPCSIEEVAAGNNGKKLFLLFDEEKKDSYSAYIYEIMGTQGSYYIGELRNIKHDLKKDKISSLDKII
ncbi:MAG: hypothetical protein M1416_03345 [Candidatus Pacearchaeota archaeon]|nr:hypothetical protein [Candidatus Pacearchaeota archaeon]